MADSEHIGFQWRENRRRQGYQDRWQRIRDAVQGNLSFQLGSCEQIYVRFHSISLREHVRASDPEGDRLAEGARGGIRASRRFSQCERRGGRTAVSQFCAEHYGLHVFPPEYPPQSLSNPIALDFVFQVHLKQMRGNAQRIQPDSLWAR